eukprot:PITA_14813
MHSIDGHLYYITFIDDFSRKTWIYYLKHKDEAFKMFKDFKALVENQTRKKIKIFRSNNGREYISNEFIDYFKKEGQRNKLEDAGRKGTFVGYYENSKAFRKYIPGQRQVEISRDIAFNEDASLGKERDLPSRPPPEKKNGDMDILDGPSVLESERDVVDDPMEPMDPLDPLAKKRPLLLRDTLQDGERRVPIRRSFRESKNPCRYQGYVAAMSTMIQAEPPTLEEAVKEQVWKEAMAEEYE